MNNVPYDSDNTINPPWLINTNKSKAIIIDGEQLTAEYIWNKKGKERENLVEKVFQHYRKVGFPYPKLSDDELKKSYEKLKKFDPKSIVNENDQIKNTNSNGLEIVKHFCGELFYNAKVEGGRSVLEVFNDDDLLKKTLKNRMGWNTTKEDGEIRPYIFGINDKMLIQGFRSSGLSKAISQFKIGIAQYLYSEYCIKDGWILDYSSGWGNRLLGAMSKNYKYIGIDPLTADNLNIMINYFLGEKNNDYKIIKGCSEDESVYKDIPEINFCFSSPPYFLLESYSPNITQCYNNFPIYSDWLEKYWKATVKNCYNKLKQNGYFGLAINETYKKYRLKDDMSKICEQIGLKTYKIHQMKTSKSHLANKKNNTIEKYNDTVVIFQKI